MASLIPLPGNALAGIGNLVKRRRGIAGSVFGKAANTQPQGPPTNPLSQAATSAPQVGAATMGGPQVSDAARGVGAGKSVVQSNSSFGGVSRQDSGGLQQLHAERLAAARGGSGQSSGKPGVDIHSIIRRGPQDQQQTPTDNSGLAARLGAESIARSRKKNKEQQAALSSQAMK